MQFLAIVVWLAAALVWYRLLGRPGHRAGNRPAANAIVLSLVCMAAGITVVVPDIYDLLTDVTGIPNIGQLLSHICTTGTLIAVHCLLSFWQHAPARARFVSKRVTAVAAVGALLMIVLFMAAETPHVEAGKWASIYNDDLIVAVYVVVWSAQNSFLNVRLVEWAWRFSSQLRTQPYIRLGLRIMTVAGLVGLVYAAQLTAVAVAGTLGLAELLGDGYDLLHIITRRSLVILWVAGVAVPTLAFGAAALRRAVRCYQMRPLWLAVVQAELTGMITLDPPRSKLADLLGLATSKQEIMLFRRVVEVRDGYLALRRWFDPDVTAIATRYGKEFGLKGNELSVAVEAATLAWALKARKMGEPFTPAGSEIGVGAGADMTGEARWLAMVSKAYAKSPVITRTVGLMTQSAALRREQEQPQRRIKSVGNTTLPVRARGVAVVRR